MLEEYVSRRRSADECSSEGAFNNITSKIQAHKPEFTEDTRQAIITWLREQNTPEEMIQPIVDEYKKANSTHCAIEDLVEAGNAYLEAQKDRIDSVGNIIDYMRHKSPESAASLVKHQQGLDKQRKSESKVSKSLQKSLRISDADLWESDQAHQG